MASSRVGLRIRTFIVLVRGAAARASSTGMENARVLPVPVCAVTTTSRPSIMGGIACACTGVGVTNWFLSRLLRNAEQRLRSEKCCNVVKHSGYQCGAGDLCRPGVAAVVNECRRYPLLANPNNGYSEFIQLLLLLARPLPAAPLIVRTVLHPVWRLHLRPRLFLIERLTGLVPRRDLLFRAIAKRDLFPRDKHHLPHRQI